jgi:hypothetical protein
LLLQFGLLLSREGDEARTRAAEEIRTGNKEANPDENGVFISGSSLVFKSADV